MTIFVCSIAATLSAQQRDRPASATTAATGTATISGRVLSDDASARPIGRAIVTLSGDVPAGRSAITEDDGSFIFRSLPPGRFTVSATKPAYLPAAYGATRPNRPGTPLALAAGAQEIVVIKMARGAVISGTIRDRNGLPVQGLEMAAVSTRNTSGRGGNAPPGMSDAPVTDDRGMYRIYGLLPGEYYVRAILSTMQLGGQGPIGGRSTTEMDALLAALARRADAQPTTLTGTPPPLPLPIARALGFVPMYFPGTPILDEAQTLTLAAGEERNGVDFQAMSVGAASVNGTISGPVPNLAAVQMSIYPLGGLAPTSMTGTNPSLATRPSAQNGVFRYTNVTPGRYRVIARVDPAQSGPAPSAGANYLYAAADIDTRGDDVVGVSLLLQPGSAFSGRLVFEGTSPPPADLGNIRVSLSSPGGSFSSSSGGTSVGNSFFSGAFAMTRADGSFAIANVPPSTFNLFVLLSAEVSKTWALRSAIVNGRDLLDLPIDVTPGTRTADVRVVLSDRHSELSGTLQAGNTPAPDYFIVAFPADQALWRAGSRRVKSTRPAVDGKFVIRDLPAGDYLLAAVTDLEPADLADPKFLGQVAPAALRLTLADGEQKTQDLRLAR